MKPGNTLRFANRVESLAVSGENRDIVVASISKITGNSWSGEIRAIEGSQPACAVSMPCSIGALDALGCRVAGAGDDGNVHVLHLERDGAAYAFSPLCALRDHDALVSSVEFIPLKDTQLVSGSHDASVKWWDIERPSMPIFTSSVKHSHHVLDVAASPCNASLVASVSRDRCVVVHDSRQAEPAAVCGFNSPATAVAWHPRDPNSIVVGLESGHLECVDTRSAAISAHQVSSNMAISCVRYSPSGHSLAAASHDGVARVWTTPKNEEPHMNQIIASDASDDYCQALCWMSDDVLASGSWDGTVSCLGTS